MSKGLEALKEYKNQLPGVNVYANDYLEIIEKELKESEKKDHYIETLEDRLNNIETTYLRELKALEIIKRTALRLVSIDDGELCGEGNYAFFDNELYQCAKLTQEEYDLLKEVLL